VLKQIRQTTEPTGPEAAETNRVSPYLSWPILKRQTYSESQDIMCQLNPPIQFADADCDVSIIIANNAGTQRKAANPS
jgi:hypothetical protein